MSRAPFVLAVCFCGVLLLGGVTATDLIRNEGLRARLASEALASGDWLVPRLSGEPHLSKPPGMSLLIVLCSLPAGRVTDVTARLPSVFAGALTLLLWAWTFRRLGGRGAGLLAVLVPCAWLWLERVPSAEIDLVQLAWVSGAMLLLLRAVEADEAAARSWPWWFAALGCVAGGLFTKWTAPAFFYLTALPWLWWRGRTSLLLRWPHLAGAAVVALLAVAWLWLAGESAGWQTLTDTLRREALLRFSPGHHPRPYPWDELLTFPLSFVVGCLPGSLVAVFALRPSFVRSLDEQQWRLWQLCQCWLWLNLVFWTLAPGHRPRHLLPAQPAVAALAVLVWQGWLTGRVRWLLPRLRPVSLLVGLLLCWLVVKLTFVATLPSRQASRRPRPAGEALAALVPPGRTLSLLRLKDDGVLFYYGRPTARLASPEALPAGGWCLATAAEWRDWPATVPAEAVAELLDGQGERVVLLRRGDDHDGGGMADEHPTDGAARLSRR